MQTDGYQKQPKAAIGAGDLPSEATLDSELAAHTTRTDNPHSVTYSQVGAASAAQGALADSALQPGAPASDLAVTPAGNLVATDVQAALEELDAEKAPTSHNHAAADINSGQVAPARGGTGADLSSAARGSIPYVGVSGAGVQAMLAPGTAGQVLQSGGAGADPGWMDVGGGPPTGTILAYGASSPPTGYLACDGSAVSRTTYAALFAVISTTWGVGDGSTTFNLPDLRGRAPIGSGTGSGLTARTLATNYGTENTTLTAAQSGLPAHTHTALNATSGTAWGNAGASGSPVYNGNTGSTGGSSASSSHSNLQPCVAVNFVIKT